MTPTTSGESLVVPTSETLKQEYFLNLAIHHEFPLTMIGPSGTGKTFITTSLINGLSTEKFINNIVNFSARTNVNYTQGRFYLISKQNQYSGRPYGTGLNLLD